MVQGAAAISRGKGTAAEREKAAPTAAEKKSFKEGQFVTLLQRIVCYTSTGGSKTDVTALRTETPGTQKNTTKRGEPTQ
jgi:hypothetical protein